MSVNRLADETSPYLRQHAENPVEWYPWGDEALRRARDEDRPLFVSIGYASCHWCHVMAHESFEDPATAAELSKWFVSVKVDREERPDLDAVYMAATQALTGSGGWPMSVFCTPDGRALLRRDLLPPRGAPRDAVLPPRRPGAWARRGSEQRDQVLAQADALVAAVRKEMSLAEAPARGPGRRPSAAPWPPSASTPRHRRPLRAGRRRPRARFRPRMGRLRAGAEVPPALPRRALPPTVPLRPEPMRNRRGSWRSARSTPWRPGGIYDHLVGGFCRYSTDARWLVPHFEKMLTDQALLARAYLHAWQETGHADYLGVVTETLDFVLRDLSTPEGALYSSFDADAGGVEGAHATFTLGRSRGRTSSGAAGRAGGRVVRDHGAWQLGRAVDPGPSRRRPPRAPGRHRRGPVPPGGGSSATGCSRPATRRC